MKQAKQEDRGVMADFLRGHASRPPNQQKVPQAQWMDIDEIKTNKGLAYDPLNPGGKVLIGRLDQQLIGIADNRHIMTVAGSRAGKSVGLISNLLFYPGSILATDPKGELAVATVKRRAAMRQKIRIVDPFGVVPDDIAKNYRASFNPMAMLDPGSDTFLEDAALIAESIVVQAADQRDPHWDDSARNFIEGVIIHVATAWQYESKRHLVTVRELLKKALLAPSANDNEPPEKQKPQLYKDMLENAALLQNEESTESISSALYGAALDFYNKTGGELSSVHSTINRHTKFLDYKAFRNVLRESDFNLADLKRDPSGVSVYLCFPATRVNMAKRWMRIFVNQLLDAMEREKTKPAAPVLACLDEFPVLGYMPQLETAAGLIASFDVKLWVILQDWSQGKALYGERWETFAGNAGILQFFGNNDLTTCEYISRRLGKTQVEVTQFKEVSLEQKSQGFTGKSTEIQLHDLLTPDEIMRLFARHDGLRRQLIFLAGRHPMILQRVEYYREGDPINILVNSKA